MAAVIVEAKTAERHVNNSSHVEEIEEEVYVNPSVNKDKQAKMNTTDIKISPTKSYDKSHEKESVQRITMNIEKIKHFTSSNHKVTYAAMKEIEQPAAS